MDSSLKAFAASPLNKPSDTLPPRNRPSPPLSLGRSTAPVSHSRRAQTKSTPVPVHHDDTNDRLSMFDSDRPQGVLVIRACRSSVYLLYTWTLLAVEGGVT